MTPVTIVDNSEEKIDEHALLIVLKGEQELGKSLPNATIVHHLRNEIRRLQVPNGIDLRLTGEVVLACEEIPAGLEGVGLAGVISLLLLAIILGFGVRSWQFIVTTFALSFVGVVLTFAYATLVVGSDNTHSISSVSCDVLWIRGGFRCPFSTKG
ncbi:MAG: putative RND superfamily exporter protein [Candidatus Azotimanducaceae bacterium]